MRLAGKTALVTGGARGIGQAVCATLARHGANVVFCDICQEQDAQETLRFIREADVEAVFCPADISNRDSVFAMMQSAIERFGHVDILVNNAAVNIRKRLVDLEPEDVARVWNVTLWGLFHCTQAAARHMVERRAGAIIMVSSIHAERAFPFSTAYNGAKAAMNHMARTWAAELAPSGVRVNIVEPGWTDTPGERLFYSEQQLADAAAGLPMRRMAKPSEIADSVAFLASEEASYITGATLRVDGGQSLPPLT